MKIEMIEFYPLQQDKERDILTGTVRVKLTDLRVHILGIFCSRRKGAWYYALPSRNAIDHVTGRPIRYPFIVIEDDGQRSLMEAIREKAPAFIEKRLADTDNPIVFPPVSQQPSQPKTPPSARSQSTKAMVAPASPKASSAPAKPRVFVDPPKFSASRGKGKCVRKVI